MGVTLQICVALVCLAAFTGARPGGGRPGGGSHGGGSHGDHDCPIRDCFEVFRDAAHEAADPALTHLENCQNAALDDLGPCLATAIADAGVCDCDPHAWGEYVKYKESPQDWLNDKCNKGPPRGGPGHGPPKGDGRGPPRGDGRGPPRGDGRGPPRGDGRGPPRGDGRGPPRGDGPPPPRGDGPPPQRDGERPTCPAAEVEACMKILKLVMKPGEHGGRSHGGHSRRQTEEKATVDDVASCINDVQSQDLSFDGCDKKQQEMLQFEIPELTLIVEMRNNECDPREYAHDCRDEDVDKAAFCSADKTPEDYKADATTVVECAVEKAREDKTECADLMEKDGNKDLMIQMGADRIQEKCEMFRTVSDHREKAGCPAGPPEGQTKREWKDLQAALNNFNTNKRRSMLESLLDELLKSQ